MASSRLTAEERQEQLVRAAVTAFTAAGYAGTTTDQVARLAGVSQPYVIRLFGTKQQLFLAVLAHVTGKIEERFRAAAQAGTSLGRAYVDLIDEGELLPVLLHGFAAGSDPVIGPVVRDVFRQIFELVRELDGSTVEEATGFLGTGMLLTVFGALRFIGPDAVPQEPWLAEVLTAIRTRGEGLSSGGSEG
jgi:AcrR family transcriptional regulator